MAGQSVFSKLEFGGTTYLADNLDSNIPLFPCEALECAELNTRFYKK